MRKSFRSGIFTLTAIVSFVLFISCADDKNDKTEPTPDADVSAPAQNFLTGNLDTLVMEKRWVDSVPNGRQVVMSYKFDNSNLPLPAGWRMNNGGSTFMNDLPIWNPQILKESHHAFGELTYFSDVVFSVQKMNKLKSFLSSKPAINFIIFAPSVDTVWVNNIPVASFISYKILCAQNLPPTNEQNRVTGILSFDDPDVVGNPSPPKGYN